MRNDWTNDIGKRMDEHRIDGFGDMWPGIEAAVKEAQAAQKRQKARAAWLRRSVAAVAAAAAVVAAVLWLPAIRSSRTAAPSGTTVTSPNIAQNDNANSSQASQTAGPAPTAEVPPTRSRHGAPGLGSGRTLLACPKRHQPRDRTKTGNSHNRRCRHKKPI